MSGNHTFLLQDVINDLINTNISIEAALFRLQYFARLVKNEELLKYTESEINGYKNAELPDYRKGLAKITANFQVGNNHHTGEIPVIMLEAPYNELLQYHGVHEGIKVLEQMSLRPVSKESQTLRVDFPMEWLHILQPAAVKIYKTNMKLQVVGAVITSNANIIIQILSTVRARLLAFSMELAEQFGYDIEIRPFKQEGIINNQTINYLIKTEINNNGDGNVINTGDDQKIIARVDIKKSNEL
ncbi:hypothetical protein [Pedobacter cryoconitis]|uniref:AbiTii domain-containing protein n=1 Tax=Pedobacter cryoconitis TaxID=188932 RepID=UPI00160E62E6|nr:hypothetical protein [Pedobacter cryoconitis]MBB5645742.1 hypothetical protein [Pedobacter cryoconitis]